MDAKLEQALIEAISQVARTFGTKAVLRGGMTLRMLGIPRSTVDADFVFRPFKSRKEFKDDLFRAISSISDERPEVMLDSRRFEVKSKIDGVTIKVEASAAMDVPTEVISTGDLASRYGIEPCIVSILERSYAFSDKLGAWLERRLERDLYDIYLYREILSVEPDREQLLARIQNPRYAKKVKPRPKLNSIPEFLEFLKEQVSMLDARDLEEALEGIVEPNQIKGLGDRILTSVKLLDHP